jgi:hypothetical protein
VLSGLNVRADWSISSEYTLKKEVEALRLPNEKLNDSFALLFGKPGVDAFLIDLLVEARERKRKEKL